MVSRRTSGYTLGPLLRADEMRFLALLPAALLSVDLPADLLAYRHPCRLTAMLTPDSRTLRLVAAGDDIRPTYLRGLYLDVGNATIHLLHASPTYQRTVGGMMLDLDVGEGVIQTGVNVTCRLYRTEGSYLLSACDDRLRTYRGYQLWDWAYGSRIEDLLGTLAAPSDMRSELQDTFADIQDADVSVSDVSEPTPFRYTAKVTVADEEVTLDL